MAKMATIACSSNILANDSFKQAGNHMDYCQSTCLLLEGLPSDVGPREGSVGGSLLSRAHLYATVGECCSTML